MSDFHQQAIEDVAEATGQSIACVTVRVKLSATARATGHDKSVAYAVSQRERVLELEAKNAPPKQELYEPGRCQICGWPLSKSVEDGCVPGNCGSRPREGSSEWFDLNAHREWLRSNRPAYLEPAPEKAKR